MSRYGTYDLKLGFIPYEDCPQESPKLSNADRIRAMTNEELAHLLHSVEEHLFTGNLWNYEKWMDWLKHEIDDGGMRTEEQK